MKRLVIVLALVLAGCPSFRPDPGPTPDPLPTSSPVPRPSVQPIGGLKFGLTLDGIEDLDTTVEALRAMPFVPWVRIVFDYPDGPSTYVDAVKAIQQVAYVVGQFSDSDYTGKMTVDQYVARLRSYITAFPTIEVWEICNECNGVGPGWNVPNGEVYAEAALYEVKSRGKLALLTPYWNRPGCEDKNGNYLTWIKTKLSPFVELNTDFVTTSIYGMDCNDGPEPSYAELDSMVDELAIEFPNALIGIGEYGAKRPADKERILRYYLGYRSPNPRYFFFGGYWYGAEDLVPKGSPLWNVFTGAK